jgi:hypothetical protein
VAKRRSSGLGKIIPIEYVSIYDVNGGGASQCTGGNQPAVLAGWKSLFAGGGVISQVMTIPPI